MSAGINVDYRNPAANPPAQALAGFRFARFVYNVSNGQGSQDFDAAHRLYGPHIDDLRAHGITPIVVINHQTIGEEYKWRDVHGNERRFNWQRMSADDWEMWGNLLVNAIIQIARRYVGMGLVYQFLNEMDQPSVAAIFVPPEIYGPMFRRVREAIKAIDSTAKVIIGGLVSGPGAGINYYNAAKIQLHDGIGVHMYGVGAGGLYNQFGTIEEQLAPWLKLKRDIWLTEVGVTDRPNEPVERVAQYMRAIRNATDGKTVTLCYFAWGVQHNGYPIEVNGTIRQPIIDALTGGAAPNPQPEPIPGSISDEYLPVAGLTARLNVREQPTTAAAILTIIKNGDRIKPLPQFSLQGDDRWRKIELPDGRLGWAHTTAAGPLSVLTRL